MDEKLIKRMFGTTQWPTIDFGLSGTPIQAQKLTGKLSISGVQPKLVVKLNKEKNQLEALPGGEYILKPQTDRFLRFDRQNGEKIHQEEFSQLLGEEDKYKGSVEQIGKKMKEISTVPGYDLQLFFERVVLNFMVANADAHLKNYTMRYYGNDKRLSPAYDIVCTRLAIPEEKEESAITINGKKKDLNRADFDILAQYLKVPDNVRYHNFEKKFDIIRNIIETSRLSKESQSKFIDLVKERLLRLHIPL